MTEPAKCPLCDWPHHLHIIEQIDDGQPTHMIECAGCAAFGGEEFASREAAIVGWNLWAGRQWKVKR